MAVRLDDARAYEEVVGNSEVLKFIEDFKGVGKWSDDCVEIIRKKFRAGYCYYFAYILQIAFNRGEVCWAAPFSHIVWVDTDKTPYDVEGIYYGEAIVFIPVSYLHGMENDFKHVEGKSYNASKEELMQCIHQYAKDYQLHIDMAYVERMLCGFDSPVNVSDSNVVKAKYFGETYGGKLDLADKLEPDLSEEAKQRRKRLNSIYDRIGR